MKFKDLETFINYVHQLSVRETLLNMGYISEDDFTGSKIRCIFHKGDNSPSLQITDNFFKCYGCNSKGDLIKFIELSDSVTFFEALQKVSSYLGADIENTKMSDINKKQKALQLEWEGYVNDFNKQIRSNNDLSKELIKQGKSFFPQTIGYDRKTNYIVLPFTSKTGGILGFTKRRIDIGGVENKDRPKWVHSKTEDTLISNCSNIFNLANANKHIKETMIVNVVEGPRDVSGMQKAKYLNTVSICGTCNFSQNIMDILNPISSIVFVMDGDEAGKKSVKDNLLILSKIQPIILLETYVVTLPEGEDPGSIEGEKLTECMNNQILGIEWLGKEDINILRDVCNACDSTIVKPHIINCIMNNLGYNYYQVEEWLKNINTPKRKNNDENIEYTHYDMLLATIGKHSNINVPKLNIDEEECKKILKLRYREEY